MNYPYQTLRSDEIRLLKISEWHQIPVCSLLIASLSETRLPYVALSYQWQTGLPDRQINLDGHLVVVTGNLWQALRRLSTSGEEVFWVDALCINQTNDDEKGSQILMMSAIYNSAIWTAVWLGEEADGSEKVMKLIDEMPADMRTALPDIGNLERVRKGEEEECIKSFLARTYWRRLWIIQEFAISRDLRVFCGPASTDWRKLSRWINDLQDTVEQDDNMKAISGLLDIRAKRYLERTPLGLLQLLKKTEYAMATYQRDKVYGLLGLAWDGQTFIQAPSYAKLEDGSFKKSDEEICKAMAHSFINSTGVLDIILLGAPTRRNPALPSWCPDFLHTSVDVCHSAMANYISGAQFKRRVGLESRFWDTTRQSRYSGSAARFDGERNVLTPRGYFMGTIRGLGCVFDEEPNSGFPTTSEDPSEAEPQTLTDEEILTAICRLLCIYSRNFHHSWERVGRYSAFYSVTARIIFPEEEVDRAVERSVLDGWLEKNSDVLVYGKKLQERLRELKGQGRFPTDAASYFEEFLKPLRPFTEEVEELLLERMRFMRLGKRDLGWAHKDARLGDDVVLLEGCSVPVILRSDDVGDKYHLVGHAYVDKGIMNGSLWDKMTDEYLNIWEIH